MKIRQNKTFEERVQNPEVAKVITIQPIERFDLDAAIIFSDILVPLYALDVGLTIKPEIGPHLEHPITPTDLDRLRTLNADEDFPYLGESIKLVRKEIPNKALIGFSGAPFTLACYLIEGRSTKTGLKTKSFALNHPDEFNKLMSYLVDVVVDQLKSQIKNGADMVQIFDSWAGFLNDSQFREWSLPHLQRLFSELDSVPTIFYARGSSHLLSAAVQTGAKGYGIDPTLDIGTASSIVGSDYLIQGNLDPAYLLSNPERVKDETLKILLTANAEQRNRYIFNLGIGIDRESSLENVRSMVQTAQSFER